MRLLFAVATLCALPSLSAQTLTFTRSVATAGFVQAGSSTVPIPFGPTPAPGFVVASGSANAAVYHSEILAGQEFVLDASADGAPGTAAAVDTGGWRIDLSQPTAGYVALQAWAYVYSDGGTTAQVSIDVGANGSIDVDLQNPLRTFGLVIGPTPTPVSIRVTGSSPGNLGSAGAVLAVVPPLGTWIQTIPATCAFSPTFTASLSASNDTLFLTHQPCSCLAQLLVLGFSTSPQVLLPSLPTCSLLMPSPDIVLVAATFGSAATFNIPVPAAVRPFSVWAQAVALQTGLGFTSPWPTTSSAYWIVGQP
jgi:hypothetical protein